MYYKINSVSQTPVSGLVADATGKSSFNTANLTASNNGQTLQITQIIITSTPTNCSQSFTQNVTMSVWTTGGGTWKGTASSDWNNASNWCGGVPTATTDVTIPAPSVSVPNQPTVGASGGVCNHLTINSGATLTVSGSNTLNVKGNWTNNGTFTCNTSTVSFTGSLAAQTIGGTGANTFNNLTINNTFSGGGVKAGSDITVNGILNLAGANPALTFGALEMVSNYNGYPGSTTTNPIVSYILYMGANATTTGQGDVTGKISRNSLTANTAYSFGNQFTTYAFTVAPTEATVVVTIGTAYGQTGVWGDPLSVKRSYELVPVGGTGGKVMMNLHYLDTELNGNTENNLTTGDYDIGDGQPLGDEHGRSGFDYTNNFIGLSGIPISYFIYVPSTHNWRTVFTLHDFRKGHFIWTGNISSVWNNENNWIDVETGTVHGTPGAASIVTIPDVTNDPVIPDDLTLGGVQILTGGNLDLNGKTLTLDAQNYNGWEDQSGLSNYSGSTVIIANTTVSTPILGIPRFNNLTINSGAGITVNTNAHVYISGTLTKTGSLNAGTFVNTIEYNGSSQTVVLPNDSKYSSLILSGSGTKTLPSGSLTIAGNLETSGTSTTQASGSLNITGNLTLGSGTTFTAGSYTHNIKENFINNGGTFNNTGNTINLNGTAPQTIGGTASTTFNHLTIDNNQGISINTDQNVDGTLTLSNGLFTTGSHLLKIGCNGSIANAGSNRYVNGKLSRMYCSTGSKDFPIGARGNYRMLTINYTQLTGTSTVTAEQFESTIGGTLPTNHTVLQDRHWDITQTGGTGIEYTLTLDGTSYNPGVAVPKIIKGDGSSNTSYTAAYNSPNFTAAGLTGFSSFSVGADCVPPTIDVQPASNASCDGSGAPVFEVTASGGTLSYQWQESVTGTGGTFNPISDGGVYSNTTTSTLTITNPPLSMDGYAYKVVVTRLCGSDVVSNGNAVLTVNPIPAITLGTNPAVCSGVTTAELSYSGTSGSPDKYRIDFDATAESAGFSDVSYTDLPVSPISINVPATPGTYNANLYVKNNVSGCESSATPFTITLYALPQGALSGSSICSGQTGTLTWTSESGSGPFTVIYNDGSDHTASDVYSGVPFSVYSSQTSTKVYTLISVTGTHCPRTSGFTGGSASVTVLSSGLWLGSVSNDWNNADNWCGGVPTSTTDVIIPSGTAVKPHITANAECNSLTINSSDSLIIDANVTLTVHGSIQNNGIIIITSNATGTGSLIENGITGAGSVICQKYLSSSNAYGWAVASPISQADNSVFSGSLGVYYYDPIVPAWTTFSSGNMEIMRGYITKFPSSKTLEFYGDFNTGDFAFTNLYRTVAFAQGNMGWNYIGNPYPSSVSWDDVVALAANGSGYTGFISSTKCNSAIYISDNNGGYDFYNNGTGTFNGIIPPATAFWIQVNKDYGFSYSPVTDAHIIFENSVRKNESSKKQTSCETIKLILENGYSSDEALIGLRDNSTVSFDPIFDALKLLSENPSSPQLYFITESNDQLAINCIPQNLSQHLTIPLGFVKGSDNSLTLSVSDLSAIDPGFSVYIEDVLENKFINLRADQMYKFSTTSDDDNRLILHLGAFQQSGLSDNSSENNTTAYSFGKTIYIYTEEGFSELSIYNMLGQEIMTNSKISQGLNKVNLSLSTGQYILKITGSTKTVTQKVFIY